MHYTSKAVYEYISKKNNDPIIERKKCRLSGQEFPIYQSDLDFYDKISPKFEVSPDYAKQFLEENNDIVENFEYTDGKLKCKIPTPTLCPEERQRRRLAFRNERKLYKRKCDFSWKEIVSIYSPDNPYKVYDHQIWDWDERDALEYWLDYNSKQSPWYHVSKLLINTPYKSLVSISNENCDYTTGCGYCKNCYITTASEYTENARYSHLIQSCKNCIDAYSIYNSENISNSIDCKNCFNCHKIISSSNCSSCSFCVNMNGCDNCFLSYNLNNQSYMFRNKKVSPEKYQKLIKEHSYQETQKELEKMFHNKVIKNSYYQLNCENAIWNSITGSKNIIYSFDIEKSEECKYSQVVVEWNNIYDCSNMYVNSDYSYDILWWLDIHTTIFSCYVFHCVNLQYCTSCFNCKNCFGCVGLRNKEYCIFNKQYTKEEYNQLVPKIITQMMRPQTSWTNPSFTSPFNKGDTSSWSSPLIKGDVPQSGTGGFDTSKGGITQWGERWEFFHPQLSPFWYNETVAMEYYPLSKEEALKLWYKWSDYEAPFPKVEKFVQWSKLWTASCKTIHEQKPELLEKLLNYAVVCEVSGRPFRIIKQEIDFYIKHDLPLPRKHPDIRHQERMNKRPWRTLYLRNCDKCGEEMLSVYPSWKQITPILLDPSAPQSGTAPLQGEPSKSLSSEERCPKGGEVLLEKEGNTQQIYCSSCYQKEIYW